MRNPDPSKEHRQIFLAGTPNSGKSSIFNKLTGLRQKVANYPGVTVEKHSGLGKWKEESFMFHDLPGCYSLYPVSQDERVVLESLLVQSREGKKDIVVLVLNASQLQRSLLLLSQIVDLGFPVIAALNMVDTAEEEFKQIHVEKLKSILQIPLIKVNGRTGDGLDSLMDLISKKEITQRAPFISKSHYDSVITNAVKGKVGLDNIYAAYLLACQHGKSVFLGAQEFLNLEEGKTFQSIRAEVEDKQERILMLRTLMIGVEERVGQEQRFIDKVDSVLTHRLWGSLIFLGVLFLLFQLVFAWATPMMETIDTGFAWIGESLREILPDAALTDLLIDGILTGIGGILIFIPQIALLFGLVAILEESGYMSRAVYLSDKLMNKTGLNGRSIVSLISGVACAVPAIMATRTIGNWKERLITILVTPFITCSARLPVYLILIAFIMPAEARFLGFSLQGIVMFGLYMLGVLTALISAYALSRIIKSKESSFLMLELPSYQAPQLRNVLMTVFEKCKVFVFEAGKVILVISVILWALSSYGPTEDMRFAESSALAEFESGKIPEAELDNEIASRKLEASYVGQMGKFMEPAIRPLGFDWKMGIALVTSFAAREVFVSTMATIYAAGSVDDDGRIISLLRNEKDRVTGEPVYTPIRALSLLLFYVFALQCMSTLAVVKRETNSWWIPIGQFFAMTGLAYLVSLFVYQIFS